MVHHSILGTTHNHLQAKTKKQNQKSTRQKKVGSGSSPNSTVSGGSESGSEVGIGPCDMTPHVCTSQSVSQSVSGGMRCDAKGL